MQGYKLSTRVPIIVIVIALFLVYSRPALAGFGVSPSRILEDRLVKGSVLERAIYLIQGTPDRDLKANISVDDTDIKSWISTTPSGDIVIPKGTQQYPLMIKITVPKDAPKGLYKAYVRITGAPAEKQEGEEGSSGVNIALGARVELDLTVGDGIHYEYAIRNIDMKNINEAQFPQVDVDIENKGNVPAGPAEASFELYNKYGDIRLAYVQGIKLEKIPAFKTQSSRIEFPISVGLSIGEYWGMIRLYNDDGSLVREFKDVFNVTEATFYDKYGRYLTYGFFGLILLFIVIFFLRRRRRA
ncbi:MAG TPA: hypothetical protein VJJ22_03465 [Candidatus Paceibacterota bacterium]